MKNGIIPYGKGQKLEVYTPAGKTDLNEEMLLKLAGFQPQGKVYGAETTAAHEFLGVVMEYLQVLAQNGYLTRLKTPADIANALSSQIPLRSALAKLLFKRATGVKGGTVVVVFNILPTDMVAPVLKALVEECSHKVLADDLVQGSKLPKFEAVFEAKPKEQPAQLAAPEKATQGK